MQYYHPTRDIYIHTPVRSITTPDGAIITNPDHDALVDAGYLPVSRADLGPLQEHGPGSESNGEWVVPAVDLPLDRAREAKTAEIRQACAAHITGGIPVNGYTYPSTPTDQTNMTAVWARARQIGTGVYKFWCVDADGVWTRKEHTSAEIEAVAIAYSDYIVAAQDKYESLTQQIAAAVTVAELNNISW